MSVSPLVLNNDLRMAHCGALREQLVAALAQKVPIVLDAHRVRFVDLATLQVLLAFTRQAAKARRPVDWHDVSPVLRELSVSTGVALGFGGSP